MGYAQVNLGTMKRAIKSDFMISLQVYSVDLPMILLEFDNTSMLNFSPNGERIKFSTSMENCPITKNIFLITKSHELEHSAEVKNLVILFVGHPDLRVCQI